VRAVRRGARGWDELYRRLDGEVRAFRDAGRDWSSPVAAALGARSIAQWLDAADAGRGLRALAASLRGFFAADPEDLSLLVLVDQLAQDADGDGLFRIAGGNDRLATALADGVPIELGRALRAVRHDGERVLATVEERGGRTAELAADWAVLALPASTLCDVAFVPALPERQAAAFRRLRYGPATKASLQFDRPFWREHGRPSAVGSDQPHGAVWDANEEQAGPHGILTLLAGGSASDALARRLATRGADAVRDDLRWLGAGEARVVGVHVARWEDEAWSRGAYAAFDPGFAPELRAWLGRRCGRVLFAGEHTSGRWQGYMNGAIESGLQAARELAAGVHRADRR
jgi:monoamine oxidase